MDIKDDKYYPQEENRTHRRRGRTFDMLAGVARDVRQFFFQNDFVITNRPGKLSGLKVSAEEKLRTGFVKVKNAFEAYFQTPTEDGINSMMLGRHGEGTYRNTNLIELSANAVSKISSNEGNTNGWVKLRVTRDSENHAVDRSGVSVYDPISRGVATKGVIVHVVSQGDGGGVVIAHIDEREDNPTLARPLILVDRDGIQFIGLPTSSAGLPSGGVYNSSGTLKIVP